MNYNSGPTGLNFFDEVSSVSLGTGSTGSKLTLVIMSGTGSSSPLNFNYTGTTPSYVTQCSNFHSVLHSYSAPPSYNVASPYASPTNSTLSPRPYQDSYSVDFISRLSVLEEKEKKRREKQRDHNAKRYNKVKSYVRLAYLSDEKDKIKNLVGLCYPDLADNPNLDQKIERFIASLRN